MEQINIRGLINSPQDRIILLSIESTHKPATKLLPEERHIEWKILTEDSDGKVKNIQSNKTFRGDNSEEEFLQYKDQLFELLEDDYHHVTQDHRTDDEYEVEYHVLKEIISESNIVLTWSFSEVSHLPLIRLELVYKGSTITEILNKFEIDILNLDKDLLKQEVKVKGREILTYTEENFKNSLTDVTLVLAQYACKLFEYDSYKEIQNYWEFGRN